MKRIHHYALLTLSLALAGMLSACASSGGEAQAPAPQKAPASQKASKAMAKPAKSSTAAKPAPASKASKKKEIDEITGLIIDKGWDTVAAECSACHSTSFILKQRGDRQTWVDMIRWMQNTQGLRQFDYATEKTIIDYLAKNYAPDEGNVRRKNLPIHLMPPKI